MTEAIAFGARLKALRSQLGMTQMQLAVLLETTPSQVSLWESGASAPRPLAQEGALARIDAELKKRAKKKPAQPE